MADRTVTLALDVTSDARDAAGQVDDLADSYASLAREVDRAGDIADQAASRLDGVTDSADGLASTSSQATGALGALSSGFDLVGLEQYSGALQGASMATDFLSGVGDSLTLVLQNSKVAQLASAAAARATTVATRAQAVAQRALNLVMSANPIGLIIAAVVLLVAGLVLLYKRSERFREIVAKVGDVGRRAISGIVDVTESLVGWVRDKVPAAFDKAKTLVVRYVELITTPYRKFYDLIQAAAAYVRDKVPAAFGKARDLLVDIAGKITSPFQTLYDLVGKLIDFIQNIDLGIIGDAIGGINDLLGREASFVDNLNLLDQIPASRRSTTTNVYNVDGLIGSRADLAYAIERQQARRNSALNLTPSLAL